MTDLTESKLPAEILAKADFRFNEYAWRVADLPAVIEAAKNLNLLNLGGQLQLRQSGRRKAVQPRFGAVMRSLLGSRAGHTAGSQCRRFARWYVVTQALIERTGRHSAMAWSARHRRKAAGVLAAGYLRRGGLPPPGRGLNPPGFLKPPGLCAGAA